MSLPSTFSASNRFPNRRRVIQACVNCRMRKTRCDAAQPKCSLCTAQNVDCVYRDAQQPRIDYNTKVLLERIQLLEDRILASSPPPAQQPVEEASAQALQDHNPDHGADVQIPLSHTANANHVFAWPIIQELLYPDNPAQDQVYNATDVFFQPLPSNESTGEVIPVPTSWRLYNDKRTIDKPPRYRNLIHVYFSEFNAFFPLLSKAEVMGIIEDIDVVEFQGIQDASLPSAPRYALLLLVLCIAHLVASGRSSIYLDQKHHGNMTSPGQNSENDLLSEEENQLWAKARLLLGFISSDLSLESAQCSMLASIYMGARGQIAEAFHWAHATAVKCETLARVFIRSDDPIPDPFRRLYWISFIYEGDFVSEISVTLPSGIARYEDKIPYPDFTDVAQSVSPNNEPTITRRSQEELVAFQITTNAAIRRFLNTINSVVYDNREQYRATRSNYASWLLRISEDLWTHHTTIYRNLPDFLLTSQPQDISMTDMEPITSPASLQSPTARIEELPLGNKPWNILRLKGRYYAGQYIIHRPFVEYALLNMENFDTHPCKDAILKRFKMCLDGCLGFIRVFDTEPVNSLTCLFPTGMVTFTMTSILLVSTMFTVFNEVRPENIEEGIAAGMRNMHRFRKSVSQFGWHIDILERLDVARKRRLEGLVT